MKKKTRASWLWRILGAAAVYVLLLWLLVAAESSSADASIKSIADALWYSLVTLSTVGYGDLFPVTPWGKVLGFLFVLMSTGLLALLMGAAATLLFSHLLPQLRIRKNRNKNWYIFPEITQEAEALAKNLLQEDEKALILFLGQEKSLLTESKRCMTYGGSLSRLLAYKTGSAGTCRLFYLGADGFTNEDCARQVLEYGYDVYCQRESGPDTLPQNLHLFDQYACCARLYWNTYPAAGEDAVILIGSGKYAQALLECGLLVNIRHPDRGIAYHVFGDWSNFRRNHPRLADTVAVNDREASGDRVIFHAEPWNQDAELLVHANRIILCDDDARENQELFCQLHRSFPVAGQVYLLADHAVSGAIAFGSRQQLFTPELVMSQRLNRTAITMHEIYRRSVGSTVPAWEELSEFLRQSNIAVADHLLTKIRLLLEDDSISAITPEVCASAYAAYRKMLPERENDFREIEHLRWSRFHVLHNWRYAPQRNNSRREHPLLLPFDALPPEEQVKDDFAWEMLDTLAREAQ